MIGLKGEGITSHMCFTKYSGFIVRLGTQEITRYGMKEKEMFVIASILHDIQAGKMVRNQVESLVQGFKTIEYSFDGIIK